MMCEETARARFLVAVLAICFSTVTPVLTAEIPPTPTAHYYGDADGNVNINLSDIAQHNAYTSFRPCTYDTLQPQTIGQYWNTCDVDGNRSCNLSDIAILNSYTSFKPVILGGDPWVLENVNLPLTGNEANTWIPFNINLYMTYSGAPSGRPGISIIAEIDPTSPGHGQLSGRSCTPVAGTRDQLAAPGAQCALAVTITDWQTGQEGLGFTESGTYGFQVWGDGDGDLKIDFHIEEWTGMDIPSVDLSQTISFTTVNQPPVWTSAAPTTATEEALYSYNMTATDPESDPVTFQVNAVTDTCGGISMGGLYSFIPGELDGGTTCVVGVQACDFTGSGGCADQDTTITVNETNLDPTVTVDCPAAVNEDSATTCTLSTADGDLPPQVLTCSLVPTPPQINIGSGNSTLIFPFGAHYLDERSQIIYLASEIGSPAQIKSLAMNLSSLSGIHQWMLNFTIRMKHTDLDSYPPIAWEGPGSGWTTVYQNDLILVSTGWHIFTLSTPFEYSGSQNLMIDYSFDNLLYVDPADNNLVYGFDGFNTRTLYYQTDSGYGDPLLWSGPSNPVPIPSSYVPNIRFNMGEMPGCTGMILNGCDSIDIPAQGENSPPNCSVKVKVSDDFTPPGTGYGEDVIAVGEVNRNPTVAVDCPANVGENTAATCTLSVSDGDLPPQALSCSLDASTTCAGATLTGCTQADVPPQGEISNPWTCDVVVNVQDNFSPPGTGQGSDTITIDEENMDPVFAPRSSEIYVNIDEVYDRNNGRGVDMDLPAQTLTCEKTAQTCSFYVKVSGSGAGEVDCKFAFTAPGVSEQCTVDIKVSDGAGGIVTDTVAIKTAVVWYVREGGLGPYNGMSWRTAFRVLQDAVDAASAGDMIWVAQGTYLRPIGGTEPVLTMKSGVNIFGGFVGNERSLYERGDPQASPSILDGASLSSHVVVGASDARLDGFTIKNGYANGSPPDNKGGGMYNSGLTGLVVTKCVFSYNEADDGGAIYNSNSSLALSNSTFYRNFGATPDSGAALTNYNSSPQINSCTFSRHLPYECYGIVYNYSYWCFPYNPPSFWCTEYLWGYYVCNEAVSNLGSSLPVISNSILWNDEYNLSTCLYYNEKSLCIMDEIVGPAAVTFSDVERWFPGEGNIFDDPLFVGFLDFHLQNGSPCINTGTATGAPGEDIESNRRPFDAGFDMGAYEYGGSPYAPECNDGLDNNGDTLTDWPADPYCADIYDDTEGAPECSDGIDNDGDTMLIDYPNDFGCDDPDDISEYSLNQCDDGLDNDGDTFIDWPRDPGCEIFPDDSEYGFAECDDGIDNDADTFVDYPDDPGCLSPIDGSELPVLFVDPSSVFPPAFNIEPGTCWLAAFPSIDYAVLWSSIVWPDHNQVWVIEGTYTSGGSAPVVTMMDGVTIYGGFAGVETSLSQRDPNLHPTILDGQGESYHVVVGASNAGMDGFKITGGNAAGASPDDNGGGFYGQSSTDVANCIFTNNSANGWGGGMYEPASVTNCSFFNNYAYYGGGGLCGGSTIINSVFVGNQTHLLGGGYFGSAAIINSTFFDNWVDSFYPLGLGGGIYGGSTVTNSIVWGNQAGYYPPEIYGPATVTYSNIGAGWPGEGNISADPLFAVGGGNVHIQYSSPCRDTGTAAGAPSYDLEGNPRPSCSGFDMGAYEYQCP